jgi:rubrerythrin
MDDFVRYIRLGKDTEKRGIKFYSTALKRVDDDNSKRLLKFLIEEEKMHFKMFTDLQKQTSPGTFDGFQKFHLKSPLFAKKDYKAITGKNKSTIDIFNTALYLEKEGMSMYADMQKKTKDKKALAFLRKLVQDEQRHYDLINAHRESLHNYIYWEGMEQPRLES